MKNTKQILNTVLIVVVLNIVVFGIGYLKYKIWRAEHPQTSTWIFIIPSSK